MVLFPALNSHIFNEFISPDQKAFSQLDSESYSEIKSLLKFLRRASTKNYIKHKAYITYVYEV